MAASKRWCIFSTGVRCQVPDLWRFASLSVTFCRLCILCKDEQQMREGSERTREGEMGRWVLQGVGNVTRVIAQFLNWHPRCHVLISILWCRTLPRGVSSFHRARGVGAILYSMYIFISLQICLEWSRCVCVMNLARGSSGSFHGYQW